MCHFRVKSLQDWRVLYCNVTFLDKRKITAITTVKGSVEQYYYKWDYSHCLHKGNCHLIEANYHNRI